MGNCPVAPAAPPGSQPTGLGRQAPGERDLLPCLGRTFSAWAAPGLPHLAEPLLLLTPAPRGAKLQSRMVVWELLRAGRPEMPALSGGLLQPWCESHYSKPPSLGSGSGH